MKLFSIKYNLLLLIIICSYGCGRSPSGSISESGSQPSIEPDYSGITIPVNIAPMNFIVREEGKRFYTEISDSSGNIIRIKSKTGLMKIPLKKWRNILKTDKIKDLNVVVYVKQKDSGWNKFQTIINKVYPDPVDPFLTYRLIYPGFESWSELIIDQRSLENFKEWHIIKNTVAEENCINCHSYNNGKTGDFLFHMRGSLAGTYFYSDGRFRKVNLKTKEMKNGAVYPRWHPSGKYVAFSVNKIVQQFHSADNKKIEVSDLESSLVLYDVDKNEMIPVRFPNMEKYMDTYPEWSPDGKYIYFCRAPQVPQVFEYNQVRYNLMKASFDPGTRSFGVPETVYEASGAGKSVSFPRVSPDGKFIIVTLFDYGCFPIWHKEADLLEINLTSMQAQRLSLNSDFTDSYHSWSSNGRWMIFSSRRDDGLTTRPYIAHMDENGNSDKPFLLPRKDPGFYDRFIKSYNIPEFSQIKVDPVPGQMRRISRSGAIQSVWVGN